MPTPGSPGTNQYRCDACGRHFNSKAEVEEHALAPGLPSLEGKKLGILDNSKTNADKYLTMVAEELQELYGVAEWRMVTKENLGSPARAEILEDLVKDSDFIITGIGD